ncbi:hypothetical protein F2P45_09715 [Massilia sp. CCM 8733]|uniref:Uncharacterized protein n=1 Tax=Massilia mucilaginosa TaxID=2609282 RepID=A0ABX0NR28_9BURK|nr:hypothetical protein [Massilia mucilaginosa]NHZ89287.1 hypothetical protein [Massilia mucilaginosa]
MSALRMLAATNVKPYVPPVQQQVTQTFTSSTYWTAPGNVNHLISVTGKGDDGRAAERIPQSGVAVSVTLQQIHGGDRAGSITWEYATLEVNRVAESLNSGAAGYWNESIFQQFLNGYTSTSVYHRPADLVAGSAVVSFPWNWKYSGPVNGPMSGSQDGAWTATVSYQTWGPALGGQPSSGFDTLHFSGGYAGPATPVTQTNVQITAGKTYYLSITGNGYITITYWQ